MEYVSALWLSRPFCYIALTLQYNNFGKGKAENTILGLVLGHYLHFWYISSLRFGVPIEIVIMVPFGTVLISVGKGEGGGGGGSLFFFLLFKNFI